MSEQKTIKNNLKDALSGDPLTNALDFVAYLKNIGMSDDGARVYYKDQMMCILITFKDTHNPSGGLCICDCPISEHDGFPIDESVKELVRANVKICESCGSGGDCGHKERGATKAIFSKKYDNLCSSEVMFINPDAREFEKIKVLMDLWKHKIDNVVGYDSQSR